MALTPGTRLGVYEILAPLGEGGMGVVYRARDTRLERHVAIKVLPEPFVDDPDRLGRFEREAKTLATLNHPHIAQVYGIAEGSDTHALVMELVEGEDLSARMARGPIAVDEVLAIAAQIAEALEAAHEAGVIHRDLKPANIKLRADGTVKILDFGLAKLSEQDPAATGSIANSPTVTSPVAMTAHGVILGTAAYMAPEQARGRIVDKRADIWAFGVVVFEMLTGRNLFEGDNIADVLGAVMRSEIDFSTLPPELPRPAGVILRRCLDRDSRTRLRDLGEARIALSAPLTPSEPARTVRPLASARRWLPWAVSLIAVSGAIGAAGWAARSQAVAAAPVRFAIAPSETLVRSTVDRQLSISRDGRILAFASQGKLFVRHLDALESTELPGITTARTPFFSPDSKWIAYFDGTAALRKVPVGGGSSELICPISAPPRGGTWSDTGVIVFGTASENARLLEVSADGGEPRVLAHPDTSKGERYYQLPSSLPDNRGTLLTILRGDTDLAEASVAVLDHATGQVRTLVRGASDARYVDGRLLFASQGVLKAAPFDLSTLTVAGDAAAVVVPGIAILNVGAAEYDVSATGTLLYIPAIPNDAIGTRSLAWRTRTGNTQRIANAPPRAYNAVRLSPDDTRLALEIADQQKDIWVWHLANQTLTQLSVSPETETAPVWSPDSRQIAYTLGGDSGGSQIFLQPADGSSPAEALTSGTRRLMATSFTPDGQSVLLRTFGVGTSYDISLLRLAGRQILPLFDTRATEVAGEISPDGKAIAYQSNQSGVTQVYVTSFPDVTRSRVQVSRANGSWPTWSRDGRELFFVSGTKLFTVSVTLSGEEIRAGAPAALFDITPLEGPAARYYDVSRDGQRFIVIEPSASEVANAAATPTIAVVVNWLTELNHPGITVR